MYNKHIVEGRLVADPEVAHVGESTKTTFRVACERSYKDKSGERKTDFFNVEVWGSRGEFVAKYFHKGSGILVEGPHENESYKDKDGNTKYISTIKASDVRFTEGSSQGGSGSKPDNDSSAYDAPAAGQAATASDDDLPF